MGTNRPNKTTIGGDCHLGYCLQCVAEYKISGEREDLFPRFAVIMAPMTGQAGTAGSCYEHLNVQPPQPQPMRPDEALAVQRLLMPNGQPPNPRHGR